MRVKAKVEAMLGIVDESLRGILLASLDPVVSFLEMDLIVADRGHRYSDGHAVASFWVQPRLFPRARTTGIEIYEESIIFQARQEYLEPTRSFDDHVWNPEAPVFSPPVVDEVSANLDLPVAIVKSAPK